MSHLNLDMSLFDLCHNPPPSNEIQSGLIERCNTAVNKKLKDLTVEDLRLLLGQQSGLDYIVPISLSILENDPLVSGDLYKGDLLSILLNIPSEFWKENPELNNRLVDIRIEIEEIQETLSKDIMPNFKKFEYQY